MSKFVHLHVHSHYSLLDGLSKIPDLVARVKELGMDAVALTDHGVMYGAIEFYKECQAQGVKPIIGMEAYAAPESHTTKAGGTEGRYFHLTLLAKNTTGYRNLIKLTTIAHLDGFYYKPRIDKKLLEEHHEGLIALSGCLQGEVARAIVAGKHEDAKRVALYYQNLFGKDHFYLEVQSHPKLAEQNKVNEAIKQLSKETGVPIVATADSHYLQPEDAAAQDIMLCVQMGKIQNDPNRLDMRDIDVSLRSGEEMAAAFPDLPEAISNTVKIANRCELELKFGKWAFPRYQLPPGKTTDEYLRKLARQGLEEKYKLPMEKISKEVCDRLDYELDIIARKGFSTYFLIVADYVNWARAQGIICATRGSAAGSLTSYCIGITGENPLKFRLPFERFLNLYRPTPPDIDMDFADDRRDEVLAYVRHKYGENKVAQICTFGAMMARAAVRDVVRALGFPYALGDRIAKMIPFGLQGIPMTIDAALEQNSELKAIYERESDVKKVIDLAKKVEGCVRHASVHAAGVVMAPTDLINFTPLQMEPGGGNVITQYDMRACEDVGLVKMDFLGVRNLSILGLARDLVKKTRRLEVDFQNLEFNDRKTFELLARGETMGVFQLSSPGMTKYLKELKPANIFDIMAMVALYRPGPMNSIPEFIRRKHNSKLITFLDPRLREILDKSYGVLTFQDDVLLIAVKLAGYSWEEADKLRKAMGKKIPAEMAKQKEKFISGCMKNGLIQLKAETIWQQIEPFAAYGFGKAHAASYGVIAYQTAYMKAHYTVEYMTAILTAESGDIDKIREAVAECRRLGIEVLPPAVNASNEGFTCIDEKRIRFGLLAIKNIGSDIIQAIIREREKKGNYETVEEFLTRVESKNLNKKSLEALIMTGAMDEFGDRRALIDNLEKLLNFRRDIVEGKNNSQGNLFAAIAAGFAKPKIQLEVSATATVKEKLAWEKGLLGLYLSDHPFREYESLLPKEAVRLREVFELPEGSNALIGGIISNVHRIFSRKGEPMYFITCDDSTEELEAIVFPALAREAGALVREGAAVLVRGKVSHKEGEVKILSDALYPLDESLKIFKPEQKAINSQADASVSAYRETHVRWPVADNLDAASVVSAYRKSVAEGEGAVNRVLQIHLSTLNDAVKLEELKKTLIAHPGASKVLLVIKDGGETRRILTDFRVNFDNDLKKSIETIFGSNRAANLAS